MMKKMGKRSEALGYFTFLRLGFTLRAVAIASSKSIGIFSLPLMILPFPMPGIVAFLGLSFFFIFGF